MATKYYNDFYPNWWDGKTSFSFEEEFPLPENGLNKATPYSDAQKLYEQQSTELLLQEFETVLEKCHQLQHPCPSVTLTPPQSPPEKSTTQETNSFFPVDALQETFGLFAPQTQPITLMPNSEKTPKPLPNLVPVLNPWNLNSEMLPVAQSQNLAMANSFTRHRVYEINPPSPSTSSNASSASITEDSFNSQKSKNHSESYYRGGVTADRKVRKKEQNKNAATRYRLKKKQEINDILAKENELQKKNKELKEKVLDLRTEIRYLKGMMKDVLKAKGILK